MIRRSVDQLGRIVIPIDMRRQVGIKIGDKCKITVENDAIVIRNLQEPCRICGSTEGVDTEFCLCAGCISKIKNKK